MTGARSSGPANAPTYGGVHSPDKTVTTRYPLVADIASAVSLASIAAVALTLPFAGASAKGFAVLFGLATPACAGAVAAFGHAGRSKIKRLSVRNNRVELRSEGATDDVAPERVLTAADVVGGLVVPYSNGAFGVELKLRGGRAVRLSDLSEDQSRDVMNALEVDASRIRIAARPSNLSPVMFAAVCSWIAAYIAAQYLGMLSPRKWSSSNLTALVVISFAAALLGLLFLPPEIVVGAEGIVVKRHLRRQTFLYQDITRAEVGASGIVLHLNDGAAKTIKFRAGNNAQAAAICRRIMDAKAIAASAEGGIAAHALLDRRGRDLNGWRGELVRLARGVGAYRTVPMSADLLADVVVNPAVTRERRLGAALALREMDRDFAVDRIRIAASTAASDAFQTALEAVAERDEFEAEVEAALREEEDAERTRRKA